MKKIFMPLAIAAVTAAVCGCRPNGGTTAGNEIAVDSTVIDTVMRLAPEDSLSPTCNFHLNFKYVAGNGAVAKLINDTLVYNMFERYGMTPEAAADSFAAFYLSEYRSNLITYYNEDKKNGDVSSNPSYTYQCQVETCIPATVDSIWGYQLESILYEGGAHGSHTITYLNFSRKTGQLITLDEVFVPGYKTQLNDILLKALMDKVNVKNIDELHNASYLTWTDMYASNNFLLGKDGMRFFYNEYEIAPYSNGSTELVIPYAKLKELLKP